MRAAGCVVLQWISGRGGVWMAFLAGSGALIVATKKLIADG
jgi:hypothetical protein